ncbi:MAG TPA: sigma-70 family RNA polymerase sigma factor [Candidatus Dormibacteraeota bacterium]|nr:sigma-70 family RNA polymerase sigma factor [Candidatus Dormibacteraeota bacterium]
MNDEHPALSVVPDRFAAAPVAGGQDWESIYRATVILVYRYIYARVGNRADAEDLTTQVYMRALPRLRLAAAIEEIRSYLVATARSVMADHWRDRYDVKVGELEDSLATPIQYRTSEADEEAGVRRAGAILGALPDHYRRVLELRFLRGYSLRETALEMGISLSNAKVIQHRALRRAASVPDEDDA